MSLLTREELRRPLVLTGIGVAVASLGASAALFLYDLTAPTPNPYRVIVGVLLLPLLAVLGLLVAALAVVRARRRGGAARARSAGPAVALLGGVLFVGTGFGYGAYRFTDTNRFCGEVCHPVMQPEYAAHARSPHARVKCVACHVGHDAAGYLAAKLRGLQRVLALLGGELERPIPTPIEGLRPARETCEQCHWPGTVWGTRLVSRLHFSPDRANTPRALTMLVKVGGGATLFSPGRGIHYHMYIAKRVEYASLDRRRERIVWIRVEEADGTVRIYRDDRAGLSPEALARLPRRAMDCLDCHNRPAHRFLSPQAIVEELLAHGRLPRDLPYIRRYATELLAHEYPTIGAAERNLPVRLLQRYRERHPEIYARRRSDVEGAARLLVQAYRENNFPFTHTHWEHFPDHIGHKDSPGCFRCHTDRLRTEEGRTLPHDCSLCHRFTVPGAQGLRELPPERAFFLLHPWRRGHETQACWACHRGGVVSEYRRCRDCHPEAAQAAAMAFTCSTCHEPLRLPEGDDSPVASCRPCHELEEEDTHAADGHGNCTACHPPHRWRARAPDACTPCHEDFLKDHNPGEVCTECHDFGGMGRGWRR